MYYMTKVKSLFASKTFWFNIIAGVVMVAEAVIDFLPPEWQAGVYALIAVANVILRMLTDGPVAITTKDEDT